MSEAQEPIPKDIAAGVAALLTSPVVSASKVLRATERFGGTGMADFIDTPALALALQAQAGAASGGDLTRLEAMLAAQATALDSLFAALATRALRPEPLPQFEALMRLALKAQNQSRATMATLADLRNPQRTTFVRQQNNTQLNMAISGKTENPPNKLLEPIPDERLDFGTQGAASGADSRLETVGTVHRPQDARG